MLLAELVNASDDLIGKLKIQRLVRNLHRINVGMLFGGAAWFAIGAALRLLAHKPVYAFLLWVPAAFLIGGLVAHRWGEGWGSQSVQRNLHNKRLRRWLDRPMTPAKFYAIAPGAIILCLILVSIAMDNLTDSFGMSSMFAMSLVWGGMRWQVGDDLRCGRCGYAKTPESDEICPECGIVWTHADSLSLGQDRVVPWMLIVGSGYIALDIAYSLIQL